VTAPASRAQDIAARLTDAGFEPRLIRRREHTRIETDVPDDVPPDTWHRLLAALENADRFGLNGTSDGRTAWAVVHTETPAADGTARGHGPPA
jgi:hypothetical protein